jgi:hypothetical protein
MQEAPKLLSPPGFHMAFILRLSALQKNCMLVHLCKLKQITNFFSIQRSHFKNYFSQFNQHVFLLFFKLTQKLYGLIEDNMV